MSENTLDSDFWNERWKSGETGWDIGYPSPVLVQFFDMLTDKRSLILVPGCGNAYEAEYLWKNGFTGVYVLDYAPEALRKFSERVPAFPKDHLLNHNFFELEGKCWDLVVEQTFFCALDPSLREKYVQKMHDIIAPGGRLAGLLFTDPVNNTQPPFGATVEEYRTLFHPYFTFTIFEAAKHSIPPRMGRELFINLRRREKILKHA